MSQIFMALLLTILMVVAGIRELARTNFALGFVLILIPIAGWISLVWEKVP